MDQFIRIIYIYIYFSRLNYSQMAKYVALQWLRKKIFITI